MLDRIKTGSILLTVALLLVCWTSSMAEDKKTPPKPAIRMVEDTRVFWRDIENEDLINHPAMKKVVDTIKKKYRDGYLTKRNGVLNHKNFTWIFNRKGKEIGHKNLPAPCKVEIYYLGQDRDVVMMVLLRTHKGATAELFDRPGTVGDIND